MAEKVQVSVIMPALNEEKNIALAVENVVEALERLGVKGEIVVVDDGSRDRTKEVVRGLMGRYAFLQLVDNRLSHGIGGAFWQGVQLARGEAVVMLPGDGENDAQEILRYLPLLDHVDIIVPFVYNKEIRTPWRRFVSKLYKAIINLSFRLLLNYMNGTVIYRRSVLKELELKSFGFFYQTELLVKSIRAGFLYAEVPYALDERKSGNSRALSWKSLWVVIKGYVMTFISVNLLWRVKKRKEFPSDTATARRRQESRSRLLDRRVKGYSLL